MLDGSSAATGNDFVEDERSRHSSPSPSTKCYLTHAEGHRSLPAVWIVLVWGSNMYYAQYAIASVALLVALGVYTKAIIQPALNRWA